MPCPIQTAPIRNLANHRFRPTSVDLRGLQGGRWQKFVTAAGMVSVVTAVLAGLCVGLLVALLSVAHPIAALGTGLLAVATTVVALMRIQAAAWHRENAPTCSPDSEQGTREGQWRELQRPRTS